MAEQKAACPKCGGFVTFVLLSFDAKGIAAECSGGHRFPLFNGLAECAQFFPANEPQWIPVSEQAPLLSADDIRIRLKNGDEMKAILQSDGDYWTYTHGLFIDPSEVESWQPITSLPPEPKSEMKILPEGCGYQGYEFGAGSYPDSICFGGKLYDADNCDSNGNYYDPMEDIPCPMCREKEAIEFWAQRNRSSGQNKAEALAAAKSLVADIRKNREHGTEPWNKAR